jgi:putative flippase GtrA
LILKNIFFKLKDYQVFRFLIVGIITVAIDLAFYSVLIFLDNESNISKAISFSFGTIFAFYANKSFTFNKSKSGLIRFFIFIILYFSTLLINVASNEFVLDLTGRGKSSFIIAFIAATFLSATLNFIGMKYVVFNSAKWFEK